MPDSALPIVVPHLTKDEIATLVKETIEVEFKLRKEDLQEIGRQAAKETVQAFGMWSEPGEVSEFRKDLAHLRYQRVQSEKLGMHVKTVIIGAIVLAALGAFASGIIAKLTGH